MAEPYASYLVTKTRDYNPDTGPSFVFVFAGTQAKMEEISAYYEELGSGAPIGYGYKTTTIKNAAGTFLTVRIPDTILYTERWSLDTEIVQIPIWWNDDVRQFMPDFADFDLTDQSQLRVWMQRIGYLQAGVNLLRRGQDPTSVLAGGTFSDQDYDVMFLVLREGDAMEWKRPVLKRSRFVPVASASRTSLVGTQVIYRTADLISEFDVPADVVLQIKNVDANLPPEFPFTVWGWKERRNDSETVLFSGKFLECRDWVYGRWSQITHTLFS